MRCSNCGMEDEGKYCSNCGSVLEGGAATAPEAPSKSAPPETPALAKAGQPAAVQPGAADALTVQSPKADPTEDAPAPPASSIVINNIINNEATSANSNENTQVQTGHATKGRLPVLIALCVVAVAAVAVIVFMSVRSSFAPAPEPASGAPAAASAPGQAPPGEAAATQTGGGALPAGLENTPMGETSPAAENADYLLFETEMHYIAVLVENTSGEEIGEMRVEATFFKDGLMLDSTDDIYYAVPPGRVLVCEFPKPTDAQYKPVEYDDIQINILPVTEFYFTDVGDQITTTHNMGAKGIVVQATNHSEFEISLLTYGILYTRGDKVVGIDHVSKLGIPVGTSVTLTTSTPQKQGGGALEYDGYEIYLINAHTA